MKNKRSLHSRKRNGGFTVAELILGLSVMAIVLTAAATLAFAMGSANSVTSKMGERQAHLRFSNMRLGELVRNSCLVFEYDYQNDVLVFWVEDKNKNGVMNGDEIALLYAGNPVAGRPTSIEIVEFPGQTMYVPEFNLFDSFVVSVLYNNTDERITELIADCSNASLSLDASGEFVTVEFDLQENGITRTYQICGAIRASADYLIDSTGYFVNGDDDL